MAKQKTGHQVLRGLIMKGYSFKQLSVHYDMPLSTLNRIANNEHYHESQEFRDKLNASKPKDVPRWADRIKKFGR